MENYEIIRETVSGRIFENIFWLLLSGIVLTINILLIRKNWIKIKEKKYFRMDKFLTKILISLIVTIFAISIIKNLFIHINTKSNLYKDKQNNATCTKIINLNFNKFGNRDLEYVVDGKERYYYVSHLPNIDINKLEIGEKCKVTYFKSSKVICAIDKIE